MQMKRENQKKSPKLETSSNYHRTNLHLIAGHFKYICMRSTGFQVDCL